MNDSEKLDSLMVDSAVIIAHQKVQNGMLKEHDEDIKSLKKDRNLQKGALAVIIFGAPLMLGAIQCLPRLS